MLHSESESGIYFGMIPFFFCNRNQGNENILESESELEFRYLCRGIEIRIKSSPIFKQEKKSTGITGDSRHPLSFSYPKLLLPQLPPDREIDVFADRLGHKPKF